MGLTARDMSDMSRLAQLAANPQDTTREEIYLAVTSLYRVQDAHLNERERTLMRDILSRLTKDVEMAIRIALAERLADDPTAPHDLILLLADDRIEVARPVILRSPLLTDKDMLQLVLECSPAHREVIASRPNIGEPVTAALAKSESQSVLVALLRNATARISPATYEGLVEKSRQIADLQEPLARRSDLPAEFADRMCTFVSGALKTFIIQNYAMEPEKLDRALAHVETVMKNEPAPPRDSANGSAQKLVDKLFVAGQLKAGFLLRVLHQGQIDLFELAFARLLDLSITEMRQTLYERGHKSVAMACRAVGIDRCVFPTVYNLSRAARSMRPALSAGDMAEVDIVFHSTTKTAALTQIQVAK